MPETTPAGGAAAAAAAPDVMTEFRRLLKEHLADAGKGVSISEREERLLKENFRVREKLRVASDRATAAEAKASTVKDGDIVLTGEDAKAWAEVKKLNVQLKDIPTQLAERTALQAEKAERDGEKVVEEVATMLDLPNARALRRLVKAEGLTVSIETVKVRQDDGKMVEERVPHVRKRGAAADAKPEPLTDVLERDYADDIPLLLTESASTQQNGTQHDDGQRENGRTTSALRDARNAHASGSDEDRSDGTRFPRQRNTAPSGADAARKKDEKAVETKARSGMYGGL